MTGQVSTFKVAVASCQENGLQISLVEAWEMQEADLRFGCAGMKSYLLEFGLCEIIQK